MSTFFIGGSQGAGTAVVQDLLCRESGCRTLPDTGYFRMLMETYQAGKLDFERATRRCFGSTIGYRRFNADIARRFLDTCAARNAQPRHLLLTDSRLTVYFPEIFELLPDAHFILVVRDPRDLIAGLLEPQPALQQAGVSHIFQRRHMRQLCQYVRGFYQPVLRCQLSGFRQRLCVFRYEDLVRKPQTIKTQLQASTGLRLDPAPGGEPPAAASLAVAGGGSVDGGDHAIGHFSRVLSRREASAIATEMHDFFVTFGYA